MPRVRSNPPRLNRGNFNWIILSARQFESNLSHILSLNCSVIRNRNKLKFSNSGPKSSQFSFYLKSEVFQNSPKSRQIFGRKCVTKNCKIDLSGHTGLKNNYFSLSNQPFKSALLQYYTTPDPMNRAKGWYKVFIFQRQLMSSPASFSLIFGLFRSNIRIFKIGRSM